MYDFAPAGISQAPSLAHELTRTGRITSADPDTAIDATGAWSIRVNLYAGSGVSYTLKWIVPEAILS